MKKLTKKFAFQLIEKMMEIRFFEEKIVDQYARGNVPGLAHLYIGQEAVAVGACACLEKTDLITSTHRGHGHCIAKGADLNLMMAELFGKKNGYCKGKGGSMHIASIEVGMLGAMGIVGSGGPIAVGAALAAKRRKSKQVVICFFGDGATNTGAFHESANLATLHKLPVIFVCENNLYGISVCMDKAVKAARNNKGPTLIECKTYRFRGHFEGDPNLGERYRTKDEMDRWKAKCPINKFMNHVLNKKLADRKALDNMEQRVKERVEEAMAFADSSPFPNPEETLEDLFI